MAGRFELITDSEGGCRARLTDGAGTVIALSEPYGDAEAAARGINAIREIAASGLIEDRRSSSAAHGVGQGVK